MKLLHVKIFLFYAFLGNALSPIELKGDQLSCDTSAFVAFLINAEDGKVLFARNAEEPFYPASTTKVATALYALHKKSESIDEIITVSQDCVSTVPIAVRRSGGKHPSYRLEFGGTHIGLKVGEQMDLKSLLYGLMLPSGNDAANVIAEAVSGSVPAFMRELNDFLQSIGCSRTQFKNPHGLPDLEHVTTAKDLAIMAQFAMKSAVFREIVSSSKFLRPQTNKQPEVLLSQGNSLVKPGAKHFYPHATGLKTGYTIQAGHAIIAAARKGDRSLIAVVSHQEGSDKRYRSVIQLFEAAFQEVKQTRTLFSGAHDTFSQKIEGAKDVLKAALIEDVVVSFYPSENKKYHSQLQWKLEDLPIFAGSQVGEVQIFDESNSLQESVPIFSVKEVLPTFSYKMQKNISKGRDWIKEHRLYIAYFMAFVLLVVALRRVVGKKKNQKA